MAGPPDTIAAIATPPGRGGIGVIRVSGPAVRQLAVPVIGPLPPPRRAVLRAFLDARGEPLDRGLALWFPAPASYTGEDLMELHAHGSPAVLDLLLQRLLALGARPARPGEFTERAFLNGKLDLVQAEAVADLIDAASAAAARGAMRSLAGAFSSTLSALRQQLVAFQVQVEAGLDFPDEDLEPLSRERWPQALQALDAQLSGLRHQASQGQALRDGLVVTIAGPPNVGKSSLLNRLAGQEAAIVSPSPGTTRDPIREHLLLDGLPLLVTDTAGLRPTDDPVEQEGIRRSRAAGAAADLVLLVQEHGAGDDADARSLLGCLAPGARLTRVYNKIDLTGAPPLLRHSGRETEIHLSAKTGAGVDMLVRHLLELAGQDGSQAGSFSARRRHLEALERAQQALAGARDHLHGEAELLAEDLRLAQTALGEILGEFHSDDLLGAIFSSFCVGK